MLCILRYARKGETVLKNYLTIAFRSLKRQKVYSLINIVGLAIGMAVFILIALYVQYELSFDRYHENVDQIFRVTCEDRARVHLNSYHHAQAHQGVALALKGDMPEVEAATRFWRFNNVQLAIDNKNFMEDNFIVGDPDFFDVFSFSLVKGDPETVFADPFSIILSENMAQKYFGTEDPMNQVIRYEHEHDLKVTGVLKNIPKNSHFNIDFIVPLGMRNIIAGRNVTTLFDYFCYIYFRVRKNTDLVELGRKLNLLPEKHFYTNLEMREHRQIKYDMQPITKIHLHSQLNFEISNNSNIGNIYISLAIAFLILVIACINYMNLAMARSAQRNKEVGIRKVVGANRRQLAKQFYSESLFFAILALILSISIIQIVLPTFNWFFDRHLSFDLFENYQFAIFNFAVVLFIGLVGGSYPALLMSSSIPLTVLKGMLQSNSKGTLRNMLMIVQFSISIILVACALVVRNQIHFMKTKDLGYNTAQIVTIRIRDENISPKIETLKNELLRHPNVRAVSWSAHLPNQIDWELRIHYPGMSEEDVTLMNFTVVDYDFIGLYGIDIAKGRNFSRDFSTDANGAFLLNESAVQLLGWKSPVGKDFDDWYVSREGFHTARIVGVVNDFHNLSLHKKIKPLYLYLPPQNLDYGNSRIFFHNYLSVKITSSHIPETISYLKEQMKKFSPQYPLEYQFFNEIFDRSYHTEKRTQQMLGAFAMIAILIACFGLFGLTALVTEQRTKEIGIRKVLGATVPNIVALLNLEFIKWILVANIIAIPIVYFAMNEWLQNFVYRVNIGVGIFILSASLALTVAMITMSYQSIKAAMMNPVESLRYE
jgi:putative ABC transport system permease protein